MGSIYSRSNGIWYSILSIRHRNGSGDGNKYGIIAYTPLTSNSDGITVVKQCNSTIWTNKIYWDLNPPIKLATPKTCNFSENSWIVANGNRNKSITYAGPSDFNGFQIAGSCGIHDSFTQSDCYLNLDYSKYFNGDRVKFEVNGKAEIVLLFQNAGNSTRDVYLETINGAILQMWTLDVDQRLIASYSYSGGVTGQGTTLGLATTGQNIRVYAIYVNSF